MQIWHSCFPSKFMNEFGLPEKHDMLCVLNSLLDLCCEKVSCLSLLYFIDISEGTASELLDNLVPFVEYFLSFFHY
jgi:hypothetical protein